MLSLANYNARARAFVPKQMADEYRFLCDSSVRVRRESLQVDALYKIEQESSPLLHGSGAGLSRADVEARRAGAK
jgi:hypothetical protein